MYEGMKPEKRNLIIEQIIRVEWEMLSNVDNIGGMAECQNDWKTFHIMRYSYYNAWSDLMIRSYMRDLDDAVREERNLVTEKYAYMMEYTDREYYDCNLKPYLPKQDEELKGLIEEITAYLISFENEFAQKYPKLSQKGRTIQGQDRKGETSEEVYIKGELRTYSKYTLQIFLDYLKKCREEGKNFVNLVKDKMVKLYGYESVEDAEFKI